MISVVVPVRNDPGRLAKCLSSLARSTYPPLEIIVVDDASTDTTARVAEASGATVIRMEQRCGPGVARNHGAAVARGEILVFVDADVCVHTDTLARFSAAFEDIPRPDAVFGAYDTTPSEPGRVSQFKNLSHHFVHQRNRGAASTFWAGCGAIRREVFLKAGGFDRAFDRPSIEDIELGLRLHTRGHLILLRPEIQATHLKRWTLRGVIASDTFDRAAPWTELLLAHGPLPSTLNLAMDQRVSAALTWVACALVPASLFLGPWALAVAALLAALVVALNWRFHAFFMEQRGPLFLLVSVPLHLIYFVCCGVGAGLGTVRHMMRHRIPEAV